MSCDHHYYVDKCSGLCVPVLTPTGACGNVRPA